MVASPMMSALATPSPVAIGMVRSSRSVKISLPLVLWLLTTPPRKSCVKVVAIPAVHKAPPAQRIADAAVYYVEQNVVLQLQGKKIGLAKAGAHFGTTSTRQINEAVHKLELTGATEELRRAALEALETSATAAIVGAVQSVLTAKAAYKAAYKAATRAHAAGATLGAARSAALEEYKVAL